LLDEAVGALDLIRDFGVGRHAPSCNRGSPYSSASCCAMLAISVLTSNTHRSMARRVARSPRGAQRAGILDIAVSTTPIMLSIIALTSSIRTSSRFFSILSQVSNAASIEREAVTFPLDHAFGFELADVGPAAIEVQR
jgi:hypothetical protein